MNSKLDIDGWLIIDKPVGVGSTRMVSKVKQYLNAKKAGHSGTLDPFASGILPIALGNATKTISYVQDSDKEYIFTVCFGKITDTLDKDGIVTGSSKVLPLKQDILEVLPEFIGNIDQIPPLYSAIKINGRRAYDLARAGEEFEVPTREVKIKSLNLLEYNSSDSATFKVVCGKGTYIRSLGRDIAEKLGTLGYLTYLRRVKVGLFGQDNKISLERLEDVMHNERDLGNIVLPIESMLTGISVLTVSDCDARKLRNGLSIRCKDCNDNAERIFIRSNTHLIGFGSYVDNKLKPVCIFNNKIPRKGR